MDSEAWILIKVQCVVYQGICLDNLYKLMESFFFKFLSFQIIGRKTKKYSTNNKVGFIKARWVGICAAQHMF